VAARQIHRLSLITATAVFRPRLRAAAASIICGRVFATRAEANLALFGNGQFEATLQAWW